MKARFLVVLIIVLASIVLLTWSVSAQRDTLPTAPSSPVPNAIDLVIVIDTSASQAYDPPSGFAYTGDPTKGCGPGDVVSTTVFACIAACNNSLDHPCYPLQNSKTAAKTLIDQLRSGVDRVAVINYSRRAYLPVALTFDLAFVKTRIDQIRAADHLNNDPPGTVCPYANFPGMKWTCGTSNPGGAMWAAGTVFFYPPWMTDTHRIVLYLGSGGINASDPIPNHSDPLVQQYGYCPPKNPADPLSRDDPPLCRDQRFSTHHPAPTPTAVPTDTLYDVKDYAVDGTDYLVGWQYPPDHRRITIYALGVGKELLCATGTTYDPGPPIVCANWDPAYEDLDSNLPNTGELFLRYMSAVSGDADPTTDPCAGAASGVNCGTYYFAPNGTAAISDALDIAIRIFGRPLPIADFNAAPQFGVAPLTVGFADRSAGDVIDRLWDFGDTFTSTQQSPTHTYTTGGVFTVTLHVTNTTGSDIITRTNYVTVYTPVVSTPYPVDMILMIDSSDSMAYDPPSGYAYAGDPNKGCMPADVGSDNVYACIVACNASAAHPCYPFQTVKDAAKSFVDQLHPGIDRIAVVSYARSSYTAITFTMDLTASKIAIDSLRATDHFGNDPPGTPCPYANTPGMRWTCGTSNPGGALWRAAREFSSTSIVTDAHRFAILISTGSINSTDPNPASSDPLVQQFGYCPPKNPTDPMTRDTPPLCRDQNFSVHHAITDTWYDAEDFAVDAALHLGLRPSPTVTDSLSVPIFAIGLGQKVVCTTGAIYIPGPPVICGNWNPAYEDQVSHLPNTGELFLRYVADIGDDGIIDNSSGCDSALSGMQCGNYYFAPTGDSVFAIMGRIAYQIFYPTLPRKFYLPLVLSTP